MTIETSYYAVRDPETYDMTFWYRDTRDRFQPWPRKPQARYGPMLWNRLTKEPGMHDYLVPSDVLGGDQPAWVGNWYRTVRDPWMAAVHGEIERHPGLAMARFASIKSRCCLCGRVLDDPDSKVSGIGPECRKRLPDSLVASIREHTAILFGEREAACCQSRPPSLPLGKTNRSIPQPPLP